jgi:hypothetical protein
MKNTLQNPPLNPLPSREGVISMTFTPCALGAGFLTDALPMIPAEKILFGSLFGKHIRPISNLSPVYLFFGKHSRICQIILAVPILISLL